MARGKTLQSLLDDLRVEAGISLSAATNAGARPAQVALLQKTQNDLWEDYDWPHMTVTRYLEPAAGQRYYSPPSDMPLDRVIDMEVRYGEQWIPVHEGIEAAQYAAYDSDLGQRGWPIERWARYENDQIELWPVPDSNYDSVTLEGWIRVRGVKTLRAFVDDSDVCDIDGRLIVLFAAATIKASGEKKDAELALRRANALYSRLRGQQTVRRTYSLKVGGGEPRGRKLRGPPTVYYRTVE